MYILSLCFPLSLCSCWYRCWWLEANKFDLLMEWMRRRKFDEISSSQMVVNVYMATVQSARTHGPHRMTRPFSVGANCSRVHGETSCGVVSCFRTSATKMDKGKARHWNSALGLSEKDRASSGDTLTVPVLKSVLSSVLPVRIIASVSFGPSSAFNTGRTDVGTNAFRPWACLIPLIERARRLYLTGHSSIHVRVRTWPYGAIYARFANRPPSCARGLGVS